LWRGISRCAYSPRLIEQVMVNGFVGIEHEAIDDAHDVVIFEDFGNGQTKLTFIGNETMENAKHSGQVEGWNQILDKVAAVVAGLAQAK
jgi:hypothetical protein